MCEYSRIISLNSSRVTRFRGPPQTCITARSKSLSIGASGVISAFLPLLPIGTGLSLSSKNGRQAWPVEAAAWLLAACFAPSANFPQERLTHLFDEPTRTKAWLAPLSLLRPRPTRMSPGCNFVGLPPLSERVASHGFPTTNWRSLSKKCCACAELTVRQSGSISAAMLATRETVWFKTMLRDQLGSNQ